MHALVKALYGFSLVHGHRATVLVFHDLRLFFFFCIIIIICLLLLLFVVHFGFFSPLVIHIYCLYIYALPLHICKVN